MPPRPITLAILAFWLATTGWLFYREIWPRLRPGEPPAYSIDLTEEVSAKPISWDVYYNGERIGFAVTRIDYKEEPSRLYELECAYTFEKGLPVVAGLVIRKMSSALRVTRQGALRQADVKLTLRGWTGPVDMKLQAEVDRGLLTSAAEFRAGAGLFDQKLKFEPVAVSEQGSILNPMHPLNRVKNLREGQNWRVPDVDPLKTALMAQVKKVSGDAAFPPLFAQVGSASLLWADGSAPCWLIEYRDLGQKVKARTWVRKSDDWVLQQEAIDQGNQLVLKRVPSK